MYQFYSGVNAGNVLPLHATVNTAKETQKETLLWATAYVKKQMNHLLSSAVPALPRKDILPNAGKFLSVP